MVLQNNGIRVDTDHTLGVAILAAHRQIESELVGVEDIVVACLGTAQSVNATVKWLVGAYLDCDASVLAVHRHYKLINDGILIMCLDF